MPYWRGNKFVDEFAHASQPRYWRGELIVPLAH
jgi:hypothetical protein